jgi:hypothetical protein
MPRQSIGERPMTNAERQARSRAAGTPVIRIRCSTDRRSRARRWHDTSAIAEVLPAICDLDLGDLQAIEPPRGSVGIEQRDGPTGMGHDDARGSLPTRR